MADPALRLAVGLVFRRRGAAGDRAGDAAWLPESLQFSWSGGRTRDQLARWLTRIDPTRAVGPDIEFVVREESREGVPVVHLFREGRGAVTMLLWVVNFMNLLNLYSLASWLPTVVRDRGHSTSTAVLAGTILQVGGTIGTIGLAWLIGRAGLHPGAGRFVRPGIASRSRSSVSPAISIGFLFVLVFIAGWCVVGGQPGINALAGNLLPHLSAIDRRGLGARHRPRRRDRRAGRRRRVHAQAVVDARHLFRGGGARARLDRRAARAARRDGAAIFAVTPTLIYRLSAAVAELTL